MTLKSCVNDTKTKAYCGPTVIAAITGRKISKVRKAVRQVRGDHPRMPKRPVTGMTESLLYRTLVSLGHTNIGAGKAYLYGHRAPKDRPTVAQWLKLSKDERAKGMAYVLVVGPGSGDHFIGVKGRKIIDTLTGYDPVFISQAKGKRKRVYSAVPFRPKSLATKTPEVMCFDPETGVFE